MNLRLKMLSWSEYVKGKRSNWRKMKIIKKSNMFYSWLELKLPFSTWRDRGSWNK